MSHEIYMKRCLQLAELGLGSVAPNPMVGCVIVNDQKIIGEGYHHKHGEAHAEVNAINSVQDKNLLKTSTLYVNLEPCAHHGKTPPCADLIVASDIPNVVICNTDPFPAVNGKGIARLEAAGIQVTKGILEQEGRQLNRRFFTFHELKRPYIILKWAQTMDAFIDRTREPEEMAPALKITNEESDRLVHKWRTEEAAIMIGKNTALLDDPKLTARLWPGKNPLRIVIDPRLNLSPALNIFSDGQPTWVFNALRKGEQGALRYLKIDDPDEFHIEIAKQLYEQGIQSVIIEGGAGTIQRFYDADLWDEARIFTGPLRIAQGVPSPAFTGRLVSHQHLGSDTLQVYNRV